MKIVKRAAKVVVIVFLAIAVLLLGIFIFHRICLGAEDELIAQHSLGRLVEVDGHKMSVYTEGSGDRTLVFLSGAGTCSPILDFKSLYSLLSDEYRIVVVEKFGYGFSDVVDKPRDIDSMLSDTRTALKAAGIEAPYILCPHSMSGLEALYWAQQYPQEVSAIIGLDMAVPGYYDDMSINMPLMRAAQLAAGIGITRFIPGISESDAIKYGSLTDEEKELYRAIFYRRTATVTMINETEAVKENAKKVSSLAAPQSPMLLFVSDGSGATGFDEETWRSIPKEYLSGVENGRCIELDCPHYVHDYEYRRISADIRTFLSEQ
ncbi:MAG: alpha/beta fold hydrolase [Oscillospiraceae bacterium]